MSLFLTWTHSRFWFVHVYYVVFLLLCLSVPRGISVSCRFATGLGCCIEFLLSATWIGCLFALLLFFSE